MYSIERLKSDYIHKCAKEGISSLPEIREKLKKDIIEIKSKLAAVEHFRLELRNLQKIDEKLSAMLQTDNIISDFDDNSEEMIHIRNSIVKTIKLNDPLTNSELKNILVKNDSDFIDKEPKIIRAVKWLYEHEFIDKDSNRKIIIGKKWDQLENI